MWCVGWEYEGRTYTRVFDDYADAEALARTAPKGIRESLALWEL